MIGKSLSEQAYDLCHIFSVKISKILNSDPVYSSGSQKNQVSASYFTYLFQEISNNQAITLKS
jgi:hypothetical protein